MWRPLGYPTDAKQFILHVITDFLAGSLEKILRPFLILAEIAIRLISDVCHKQAEDSGDLHAKYLPFLGY